MSRVKIREVFAATNNFPGPERSGRYEKQIFDSEILVWPEDLTPQPLGFDSMQLTYYYPPPYLPHPQF